jgi:hypothetical protein
MQSLDAAFQGSAISPEKVADDALNLAVESQKFLKKSVNAILPVMLLLGGVGTIVYRFSTAGGVDPVKNFLIMVTVQLLPMAALKLKTWICSDRVSLMPSALVKTLMMHISVQLFRVFYHCYVYFGSNTPWMAVVGWQQYFDCFSCAVAMYIVIVEFGLKFQGPIAFVKEHSDVLTCIAGGCVVSVIVNLIAPPYGKTHFLHIINDWGNYAEVLAFVPVVRIVCLENGVEEQTRGTQVDELDRRKALVFMTFILGYYFWDDIIFSVGMAEQPLVAAPKAAHFVMLMDFTFYFVLKVGAQPKIINEILPSILPDAVLQDVMPQESDAEKGFVGEEHKGLLGADEDDEDAL